MAGNVLTDSEVLEILYNSDESFSDSISDSIGSSVNEIDDTVIGEAIINDDMGDYGPRSGAENVTFYNNFSCFLTTNHKTNFQRNY
jgi:hypothetical protein